jgi:hypothetical protein
MSNTTPQGKTKLTAVALKNVLWDTLNDVRTGVMDPGNADSIATQGREIIRTVNTQLRISHQSKRPVPTDVIKFSENTD